MAWMDGQKNKPALRDAIEPYEKRQCDRIDPFGFQILYRFVQAVLPNFLQIGWDTDTRHPISQKQRLERQGHPMVTPHAFVHIRLDLQEEAI
jgi:hypothetical protein